MYISTGHTTKGTCKERQIEDRVYMIWYTILIVTYLNAGENVISDKESVKLYRAPSHCLCPPLTVPRREVLESRGLGGCTAAATPPFTWVVKLENPQTVPVEQLVTCGNFMRIRG